MAREVSTFFRQLEEKSGIAATEQMLWESMRGERDEALAHLKQVQDELDWERAHSDQLKELLEDSHREAEEMRTDYIARLRGLGMTDEHIQQFDEYWRHLSSERRLADFEQG